MSNTALLGSYGAQDSSSLMFRNRIINGDMRIDQRNSGASVATGSSFVYPVDRFRIKNDVANGNTQRSTTAPVGFTNSLVFTTGTGGSPLASNACTISQPIEGFSIAELAWGTANAQAVTVSFWVRSSLTGTFAFRISNGVRSYVATYTINAANTFEYKTITVAGDTSGTWATDNSAGMYLNWDLGSGSSFNAASVGSWVVGDFLRVSGTASVIGTTGATFYITGVQLEAGPTATPFERRPIGVEQNLCERYCEKITAAVGIVATSTTVYFPVVLKVTKRDPNTLGFLGLGSMNFFTTSSFTNASPVFSGAINWVNVSGYTGLTGGAAGFLNSPNGFLVTSEL